MPGAPTLHGYGPSTTTAEGLGGSARGAAAAAGLNNIGFTSNLSFFVWLVVIGVVIPGLIIGGLRAGRFQFVFRGR